MCSGALGISSAYLLRVSGEGSGPANIDVCLNAIWREDTDCNSGETGSDGFFGFGLLPSGSRPLAFSLTNLTLLFSKKGLEGYTIQAQPGKLLAHN
jgi:hypothetical protein